MRSKRVESARIYNDFSSLSSSKIISQLAFASTTPRTQSRSAFTNLQAKKHPPTHVTMLAISTTRAATSLLRPALRKLNKSGGARVIVTRASSAETVRTKMPGYEATTRRTASNVKRQAYFPQLLPSFSCLFLFLRASRRFATRIAWPRHRRRPAGGDESLLGSIRTRYSTPRSFSCRCFSHVENLLSKISTARDEHTQEQSTSVPVQQQERQESAPVRGRRLGPRRLGWPSMGMGLLSSPFSVLDPGVEGEMTRLLNGESAQAHESRCFSPLLFVHDFLGGTTRLSHHRNNNDVFFFPRKGDQCFCSAFLLGVVRYSFSLLTSIITLPLVHYKG